MTQPELFVQQRVGNLTREVPLSVGRITQLTDERKARLAKFEEICNRNAGFAPHPPSQPVATSIAAADAIAPSADRLRKQVFEYISEQGARGATDEECQLALGMAGDTQRPRRIELFQAGKICMAPEMRLTRAKRKANVWVANSNNERER
jgi:hypothetical protein